MSWKKVCSAEDVHPGEIREVDVEGVIVAVVPGRSHIAVIPPMCPHLEEPLCDGITDGSTLTCHKHLWQWDLDTGSALGMAQAPLKKYESKVEGGVLYALIDREITYDYD